MRRAVTSKPQMLSKCSSRGASESCVFTVLFSLFLPGSQDCLPPAASSRRRRLARRPGYMRSAAGPWIGFLFSGAATPLRAQGGACGEESHQSESRAGRCGLDPGGQRQGPLVGSPVPRSTAASALTSVGYLGLALTPVRGPSGLFGIQLRAGGGVINYCPVPLPLGTLADCRKGTWRPREETAAFPLLPSA